MATVPPDVPRPPKGECYTVLPDGRWAIWFDAHMIDSLMRCEKLFYYRQIRHLRQKGAVRPVLSFGTWWSNVLEDFYLQMQTGTLPTKLDIVLLAIKHWQAANLNEMRLYDPKKFASYATPMRLTDAVRIGGMNSEMEAVLRMIAYDDPEMVALGPVQMASRYYDSYATQDFYGWKIISAEQGFGLMGEVIIGENDKVVAYYLGKPDLVIYEKSSDALMPLDHKTKDHITGDFDRLWKPHSQTAGYIYAVGQIASQLGFDRTVDRCIINGAARIEPSEKPRDGKVKPRFKRAYPHYSPDEIEEWRRVKLAQATRLRHCIENDEWVWKTDQCHLFGGCDYRRIDCQPPGSRALVIGADFQTVEPWAPYAVEEDNE